MFGRGAAPGSYISTHAPHAGSDLNQIINRLGKVLFQPTLPMRGATGLDIKSEESYNISTHAPHAGSDPKNQAKEAPK